MPAGVPPGAVPPIVPRAGAVVAPAVATPVGLALAIVALGLTAVAAVGVARAGPMTVQAARLLTMKTTASRMTGRARRDRAPLVALDRAVMPSRPRRTPLSARNPGRPCH